MMKIPFRIKTLDGVDASNIDLNNFYFNFFKNGKKLKVSLPKPVKTKSGGYMLKLNETHVPLIGELMLKGKYVDVSSENQIVFKV